MNGFQIVSIAIAALFSVIVVVGLTRRRIAIASALFWLTVWIGAAVVILNPEWTRVVAEVLGIARGADLVFYCAILAMFIGFFLVYAKLRRLDSTLTRIVRALAIEEARPPGDAGGAGTAAAPRDAER
jgi:hypothetical protein